ncbi:MAG TPA: NAD(P)H-dependent oxidoreductase subunit E [Syntrophomonadaceae bacterium]|nr:NAD(P)H-dependent oxidoreductase subunit E [Syntrophomonadaceae bacterium]HOQ10271.1 NAD(P)H-dependent oxidoreductase subunit E [Syntrophomonadaceae bacterium]HPU49755.1 NAD(P)H-dependent oxidoreductase subunit E [Syntrophomonadaceae bacterium]
MDYRKILSDHANVPGGLVEAFHAVQAELGYLPKEVVGEAAKVFNIPASEAYGVATFYSMFSVKSRGKNVIRLCESAPCHVAGAAEVVNALERELGVKMGESTPDGLFALEFTQCVGQCQATPVITINGKPYLDVKPAQIPSILSEYRK